MTPNTQQCSICLDAPPYDKCLGLDCARLAHCTREREAAEAYATRLQGRPICERGDAVNLASNTSGYKSANRVTAKGVMILCDAVLRMDAYIREWK